VVRKSCKRDKCLAWAEKATLISIVAHQVGTLKFGVMGAAFSVHRGAVNMSLLCSLALIIYRTAKVAPYYLSYSPARIECPPGPGLDL
jgi:hypothetical protein